MPSLRIRRVSFVPAGCTVSKWPITRMPGAPWFGCGKDARTQSANPIRPGTRSSRAPAMATCTSVSRRLHDLSERVARASALLSTRVDIARERQNQALLASMDRRAQLQLRLQQTVEGLSVAAIVYYASGLVGYLAKAGKAAHLPINPDLVVGAALPVLFASALKRRVTSCVSWPGLPSPMARKPENTETLSRSALNDSSSGVIS